MFVISIVLFGACFNQPEFSNSPTSEYEGISFQKAPNGLDSLIVSISFKDGDGDLGLSASGQQDSESPFHEIDFYANDNGALYPIPGIRIPNFTGYRYESTSAIPRFASYYIEPDKQVGELITLQSRNEGFTLPPFSKPYDCFLNKESYLNESLNPDTVFIFKDDDFLIKDQSKIVDKLVRIGNPDEYYYAVVDYFYIKSNPFQYNFIVEFLVKNNDGTFTEYDFREQFCETYDGRFPVLADKQRALEGVINYSMVSSGFLETFSIKTLKLRLTIYDRALNISNTVETPEFRLEEI